MLRKVQCVTFPRSGHHLLVNLLLKYFSKDLSYPEFSGNETGLRCKEIVCVADFHYCEFYNHCRKVPCVDSRTNFQKQHDADLKLKTDPALYYLIQYRNPLDSLVSGYRLYVSLGLIKKDSLENWLKFLYLGEKNEGIRRIARGQPWLMALIRNFMPTRLNDWKRFVHKWVLDNTNPNTHFLPYHKLVLETKSALTEVIRFLDPVSIADEDLINAILKKTAISQKNAVKDFRFYDERFFKDLEKKIRKELDLLGIAPVAVKPPVMLPFKQGKN